MRKWENYHNSLLLPGKPLYVTVHQTHAVLSGNVDPLASRIADSPARADMAMSGPGLRASAPSSSRIAACTRHGWECNQDERATRFHSRVSFFRRGPGVLNFATERSVE